MPFLLPRIYSPYSLFFFPDAASTEIYTLSLHDALPIFTDVISSMPAMVENCRSRTVATADARSEEHTSELQSPVQLVCRLLLEKKNAGRERRLRRQPARAGHPPAPDPRPVAGLALPLTP